MADTKISGLTATTLFEGNDEVPVSDVTNTSNKKWMVKEIGGMTRRTITATSTLIASDRGKIVDATSGTFSVGTTAAATLLDGWWCILRNSGTGVVTLDPNGAETIDGNTTLAFSSRDQAIVMTDGTNFFSLGLINRDISGELKDIQLALFRESTLITIVSSTTETDIFNQTVPANIMGTNRMLKLTILADRLNNSGASETAPTFRIYVGGTVRFQDTMTVLATSANRQGWHLEENFAMQNATNVMNMNGFLSVGAGTTAPTTGIGDTTTDEISVQGTHASAGTFTQDTTATFAIRVTIQLATNNANTDFRRQYAILELI